MFPIKTIAAAVALLLALGLTVSASVGPDPVRPGGTKKQDKNAKKFSKKPDKEVKKEEGEGKKK